MATQFNIPRPVKINVAGRPYAGAQAFFYQTGTETQQAVYQDANLTEQHPQPVLADDDGYFPIIWLDPNAAFDYRFRLLSATGAQLDDDQDIPRRAISVSQVITDVTTNLDSLKVTDAETAVGSTPTNKAFPPNDVRRYGWSESNTATANATALTSALAALNHSAGHGGTILLPPGSFNCSEIVIPQRCWVRGAGAYSTLITYAGSGTFCSLGGSVNTGALKVSCGISDFGLVLTHKDGEGVRMRETQGAILGRAYIEGPAVASRTNRLVVIDGGDVSSFFNGVEDVICNHGQNSFVILTSGSQRATNTTFINCSAFGDVSGVGTNSKGFSIQGGRADGTVWFGGNFESCGTGIYLDSTALSISVYGTRFESNTKDVVLTSGCKPSMFFGLQTDSAYNVTDTAGVGGFYGCTTIGGSRWAAQGQFVGTLTVMASPYTANFEWRRQDKEVEIYVTANTASTLNGTSLSLSGLPAGLIPSAKRTVPCVLTNSGGNRSGYAIVNTDGTMDFMIDTVSGAFVVPSLTGFTTSTNTGFPANWSIRYGLD